MLLTSGALAQPSGWNVAGQLGLGEKYDDNVDLSTREDPSGVVRGEPVTELHAGVAGGYLGEAFDIDARMKLRIDEPNLRPKRARLYTEGELYLAYRFSARHAVSFASFTDCFLEPDDGAFDVCRGHATLAWRAALTEAWRLQVGTESLHAEYFQTTTLSYDTVGAFFELRYLDGHRLSYWARGTAAAYHGAFRAQASDVLSAPSDGLRMSHDLGVDWVGSGGVTLLGTLRLELDNSPETGLQTVDGTSLADDDLETDAQFNYRKLRGTTLLSWRLDTTWTLGAYGEAIVISFVKDPLGRANDTERRDFRYLVSASAAAALTDALTAKLRGSVRQNISSVDSEDYVNRILYLGVEYRW